MNVTGMLEGLDALSHVGVDDIGVGLAVSLIIAAAANSLRPTHIEDETIGIGGWHRASGWHATCNEILTAVLSLVAVWRLYRASAEEFPAVALTDPLLVLHILTAALFVLPKLPPIELLYDFLTCHSLWFVVLFYLRAESVTFDVETVATRHLPMLCVMLFPAKSIWWGEITFLRFGFPRVALQSAMFHLGVITPYAIALRHNTDAPTELGIRTAPEQYVTALQSLPLPQGVFDVAVNEFTFFAFYPLVFVFACVTRKSWDFLFQIVTARKRTEQRMLEEQAAPEEEVPMTKKSKKTKRK